MFGADIMKFIGLVFVVLILGLILKDAGQFSTVISQSASAFDNTIGQLQKSG